ncbi:MAG: 3-phosphoshikimate 1-carboxyvinyltransferase [Chloroflexota bacterium]
MRTISIQAPSNAVNTVIELPLSKSISNRMLIIGYLAGIHKLIRIPDCEDSATMLNLIEQLVSGKNNQFDAGDAGTVYRFLTALFSIIPGERVLKGSARMHQRPIGPLVEALKSLGADITYISEENYPPLLIQGKALEGGAVDIDGSVSSQFISAMMMIAPYMKSGLTIKTHARVSRPYIEMTLSLMKDCGIPVFTEDNYIRILPGKYSVNHNVYEADWSAASYWYALSALSKNMEITLKGLKNESSQGDSVLPGLFEPLGVVSTRNINGDLILNSTGVTVDKISVNLINNPDLAPALAVACAGLQIESHISGLDTLAIKESNRLQTIKEGLNSTGFICSIHQNSLIISKGRVPVTDSTIKTYNDHRIAMAMSLLSLTAGQLIIDDADVVRKSYPQYWDHLKLAGFTIRPV